MGGRRCYRVRRDCGRLCLERHAADVEPTVREFAEFRDALSQQVAGVRADTRNTRQHAERPAESREPDATTK